LHWQALSGILFPKLPASNLVSGINVPGGASRETQPSSGCRISV
jgi:hypothetical protein